MLRTPFETWRPACPSGQCSSSDLNYAEVANSEPRGSSGHPLRRFRASTVGADNLNSEQVDDVPFVAPRKLADLSEIIREEGQKNFVVAIAPVGGSSVTLRNGFFILSDGTKIPASDTAIKLRGEWEQQLGKFEAEAARREKQRLDRLAGFKKPAEDVHEPERFVPPEIPTEAAALFALSSAADTGPYVDDFMEQPVKTECLDGANQSIPKPISSLENANLPNQILENLKKMGITDLFPIQRQIISLVLNGVDVIGSAPTGTGKTAAYLIPLIAVLLEREMLRKDIFRPSPKPAALILVPSRELAEQILLVATQLAHGTPIRTFALYGALDADHIRRNLMHAHIVVGTPGRVLEHVTNDPEGGKSSLHLSGTSFLIIDEVDKMVERGFPDVTAILNSTTMPRKDHRQTMFFSATIPYHLIPLLKRHLHRPYSVKIGSDGPVMVVQQRFEKTVGIRYRMHTLRQVLDEASKLQKKAIVFVGSRNECSHVARNLQYLNAVAVHGDLMQEERNSHLELFRSGESRVLVATDVAARGIDIECVGYVVNYTAPRSVEDYIHRIGRTARKGHDGVAVTFLDPSLSKDRRFIPALVEMLQTTEITVPEWLGKEAQRSARNFNDEENVPSDAEDLADIGVFHNADHEYTPFTNSNDADDWQYILL